MIKAARLPHVLPMALSYYESCYSRIGHGLPHRPSRSAALDTLHDTINMTQLDGVCCWPKKLDAGQMTSEGGGDEI